MSDILILDDDRFLADSISRLLASSGLSARTAHDAAQALRMIQEAPPKLLILDLGLPDQDGISVCRKLRASWQFPILMLTSRLDTLDKVVGLEVGADDYMTKPFDGKELLARVRAQLRRSGEYQKPAVGPEIRIGSLVIDPSAHVLTYAGKKIDVTETEYRILGYLASNIGRALSREQVFETVWGYDLEFSSNSLEVLIYRLRQKMSAAGCPPLIKTVRGYGYKLEPGESHGAAP